jgi:3-dehydroquinate synthase
VDIKAKDHHYTIDVGQGVLETIADNLSNQEELESIGIKPNPRLLIITDSNVKPLYADSLEISLREHGLKVQTYPARAGEQSKSRQTRDKIENWMLEQGYDRNTVILAVGGGVVGDLAGTVAYEFLRGIHYIQVPTTLLAQVDSSVGGKVAVNTPKGKNLIGGFWNPSRVYADPRTLLTLDKRNLRAGLAEVIKYGIILDKEFFEYLQQNIDKILARDLDVLTEAIISSCELKANVVMQDPEERLGNRMILNFGHTIGHAVEQASGYKLYHGEAVAIGMMAEARIAVADYGFPEGHFLALNQLVEKAGLPTRIPLDILNKEIIMLVSRDKKAKQGRARFPLPAEIGKMHKFDAAYADFVDNDIILQALDKTR